MGFGETVAAAAEPRHFLGVEAIRIDGIRDARIDAARRQCARLSRPQIEVFAPVTRRGVDETGPRVVRDMLAFKQRHGLLLDWVYVAKMMLGIFTLARNGALAGGTRVVAVVTG